MTILLVVACIDADEVCASAMRFLESLRGLVRGRFGRRLLYRAAVIMRVL